MSNNIKKIDYAPVDFTLEDDFSFGNFNLNVLEYVLVEVEDEEGNRGLGEAPAYWDPNGETQESVLGALDLMKGKLEGRGIYQMNEINDIWEKNCRRAYAARCAVDIALHDVQGKNLDLPVYRLIGGDNGEVARPVTISLEKNLQEARDMVKETDSSLFKLKADEDTERLNGIAEHIYAEKTDPTVSIDVNQLWETARKANKKIEQLEFTPDWIEQPITSTDKKGLEEIDAPVMADEAFYSVEDVDGLADKTDLYNVKLAKTGGIHAAQRTVNLITVHNREYIVGSMLESPIGSLAAYHFARAYNPVWLEASGQSLIEGVDNLFKEEDGVIKIKEGPGLGVEPEHLGGYFPFDR